MICAINFLISFAYYPAGPRGWKTSPPPDENLWQYIAEGERTLDPQSFQKANRDTGIIQKNGLEAMVPKLLGLRKVRTVKSYYMKTEEVI
eukprot:scaffold5026_cov173-Cylindrotheca_fusiformis.AAC.1